MQFGTRSGLALLVVGVLLPAGYVRAQQAADSDIRRRLAELEQQVATLQRPGADAADIDLYRAADACA